MTGEAWGGRFSRFEIEPALHYLLAHFDNPFVDGDAWSLEIGGAVASARRSSLADVRSRP